MSTENTIRVSCDGACLPVNPGGTAMYGFVIEMPGRDEPICESGRVGEGPGMSNNVAEYGAITAAVEYLLDHVNLDGRDVRIRSDSQLVINQLKGKWRVKDGNYVPYYEEAAEALQLLSHRAKSVQLYWIPREKNNEADTLSKMVSSS